MPRTHAMLRHLAIALTALLFATTAQALGLGDIKTESKLGEPLAAQITLTNTDGLTEDDLIVGIADVKAYERMGIEREYLHTRLQFATTIDKKTGQSVVQVTTKEAITTPVINFVLHVRWPKGNAMRAYTILLDTPLGH
ncbi:MAG TPA: hypothetical protein VIM96_00770 [Pseudomonadales bacterium]